MKNNAVLVLPTNEIPEELLYRPADCLASHIRSLGEACLVPCRLVGNEDLVELLGFHLHPKAIGDTVSIFRRQDGGVYRMSYLEADDDRTNVLASVFHPELHRVKGRAVISVTTTDGDFGTCSPDDVLYVLTRRAFHRGLRVRPDGSTAEVEIDNAWNIVRGCGAGNTSLRGKSKRVAGDRIVVEEGDDRWWFELLEPGSKVIVDAANAPP